MDWLSHMACREKRRINRRALSMTALCIGSFLPLLPADVAAQDQPAALPSLQVVVLVDESGSIKEPDLVREKEAARTIAFSALAPGSVVSVVGFGSSEKPGQSAVDVVCQPTRLDAAQKRDSLAKCIGNLRKRTDADGDGTDHVAALQQALDAVRSEGPAKKIVFLLTDGKLDVSNSPSWGDTPPRRNGAAASKVKEVLNELNDVGAQVWPFGFGAVDTDALRGFARGKSCTPAAPDPHEQIVPTSTDLTVAIMNAFSSASCVKFGPLDIGNVPLGGSADLHVDIPAVASDASIVVYKRDPRVQVEYQAPNAGKPAPAAGGSRFEFAGQATETESLRITDPEPGRWTIHLSSAGVPAQDVAATVVYQAAVKAYLTASPPQPAPGQTVDVNMQVWARGRAVTDAQTLQGLTFVTTLTSSTGFPPQQVTLTDPDRDGTFAGQLEVPDNASGDLKYTGQVTGIGVGGDTRELSTTVQKVAAAVQAQILFTSNRAAVTPGGTVSGTVSITNASSRPARLRLRLDDISSGTTLTVDPAIFQAASGSTEATFALRFGQNTPVGMSGATLRLVDDADPSVVVAERLFATEVAPEPGLLERFFWVWTALAVLVVAALALLLMRMRSRSKASEVGGLTAQLWQGGVLTFELVPPDPHSKVLEFVMHADFTGPQLQPAGPGDVSVYKVRRATRGISLVPPGLPPVRLAWGERRDVGRDLAVAIVDGRAAVDSGAVAGPPANPFAGFPADPFASASFDSDASNGAQHAAPPRNGSVPSADRDSYLDPNNPFA